MRKRKPNQLLRRAEDEFAGCGATVKAGLNEDQCFSRSRFREWDAKFADAIGSGGGLAEKGFRNSRCGELRDQLCSRDVGGIFRYTKAKNKGTLGGQGVGIQEFEGEMALR